MLRKLGIAILNSSSEGDCVEKESQQEYSFLMEDNIVCGRSSSCTLFYSYGFVSFNNSKSVDEGRSSSNNIVLFESSGLWLRIMSPLSIFSFRRV